MRHWASDYSDGELILAIASPHLVQSKKDELEAEFNRRQQEITDAIQESGYRGRVHG